MQPLVTIVILNWNVKNFLANFLPSVLQTHYVNHKVVVADNASTDGSENFCAQHYPQIQFLKLGKNRGYAGGYNAALRQLQSDYFVLLNSDVEVTANWLDPIISLMETNRKIAASQPKILMYEDRKRFEYAGACGGWIDFLGYPFARGRIFETAEHDAGQYNSAQPCFWASGAAFVVRASAYWEMNGLDEYFFAHQEEIDLCWRLQRAGYFIYVVPQSQVYHVGGGTLPKTSPRKTFLNFRNNLIMMHKNLLRGEKAWKIPLRIILDWVAAAETLLRSPRNAFAVLRAHVGYAKWLTTKKTTPSYCQNTRLNGVLGQSIVWKYFVEKKKTFSEIFSSK